MKFQILFSGENDYENIINLSASELAYRVVYIDDTAGKSIR